MSRHTEKVWGREGRGGGAGGGKKQCHMRDTGSLKSAKKVSRLIWMAFSNKIE